MIVADTGAVVALLDADDRHHPALRQLFLAEPAAWRLPWSVLPEVDYLVASRLGRHVQSAFVDDLVAGAYVVEWGEPSDLERAHEIAERYRDLELGLVDATVIAAAERVGATAIATLDLRHFGAVEIRGHPRLVPRDL